MKPETLHAIACLDTMSVGELRARFLEVCGEPTASRHLCYLRRRIAWRLQANDEGGLSERALKRAEELARHADIRVTAPRSQPTLVNVEPSRVKEVPLPQVRDCGLAPGTLLRRAWKGGTALVTVLPAGFLYEGKAYRSLSAVATAITGTKWNGFVFFGLKKQAVAP